MMYALISPTDAIDREVDEKQLDLDAGVKSGWRWVPIEVTNPSYNSATQIRTGPVNTVLIDKVTRVWTVRNKTAQELSDELNAQRDNKVIQFDEPEDVLRAFVLTLLDELNLHATRTTAILTAVDSSSTYAALRTAIAAIPDVPQRTIAQLRTSIRNKLGT